MPFGGRPLACPLLVGRGAELRALEELLREVTEGRRGVAVVSGEAGTGKSRLVAAAVARARALGFLVLQGGCSEADWLVPFAPVADLLRSFSAGLRPDDVVESPGGLAGPLTKLVPELDRLLSDIPTPVSLDPDQEKPGIFRSVAELCSKLSASYPLLMVIEDLQWSHRYTLELLLYLVHKLSAQRLALFLTHRSEEIGDNLSWFLAQLERSRTALCLELLPLTQAETEVMVQILVDAPGRPDMGSVRAIHQLSGGVPLLVEELVKSAFSSGANLRDLATDWNAGAEAVPIPRVVQEAVRKKWTGLRADTRAVLTVAAVMGRSFDFEIVAAVTGLSRQALVAAIGEAMAVHLVMEQNSGRLAFRQALVREALYRQILALERRDIHLAVAEALERASGARGEARWEELSYHFFLGEAWDKAVNYALQAAYRCAAMQAQRLVVLHCSRVLDAARWLGQDAPVEVLRMRGMAREALGDFAGALEDLEAALVGASDDPGGRWQAVVDLGTIWSSRDYARCGQYCREALELAHRTRDRQVVARSLNCMGSWLVNVGRIDEGIACHEEARSVFEETGDAAQVTDTLSRLGMAWLAGGNMVKSAQYCRSALGSLEGRKDLRSLASVLISLALCGPSYQGMLSLPGVDPESACQFSQKALALAHDMEWRSGEACALWALGAHELARGRLGSAEEHARGAFQIATESGNLQCMVGASLCLGGVHAEILDYAGAAQHFSEARALAARVGAANLEGILVGLQTACMAEGGDIQAARLTLSTFNVDLPCESLGYRWLWYGRMWLALAEGDNLQALEISRTLCLAAGAEGTAGLPLLERARARGLAGLGRMLEAEATLKKALEDAQGQGLRLVLWRLHFDLGRLYRAAGRHREAAEALASSRQAAAELAGSLPEGPLRRGFLEHLARLVPARSGSVGQGVAGLTGRELQVLAMLAQGKSNRSIAEELVVSERTVETHVSSIFRKLGLSSRTQVVAWAFERSPDSPSQ